MTMTLHPSPPRRRPRPGGRPDAADGVFVAALAGDRAAAGRRRGPAARRPTSPTSGATCSAAALPIGSFVLSAGDVRRAARPRRRTTARSASTCTTWIQVGGFDVGMDLLYDPLSALFVLLITGVGSLIHVYSIGYMEHDPRRRRFFAYLNLFVAAMLMLVLADNYLALFLGWEGVGLASYLLIGFWQHKHVRGRGRQEGVRRQPGRRHRHVAGDHADVRHLRHHRLHRRQRGRRRARRRRTLDRARPAAAARRLRQVRPGAAAGLAARRDGGPDPGVGADPRGDHGDRRRLPDRPLQLHLRARAGRRRPRSSSSASVTLLWGAIIGCAKDDIKKALAGSTMSQIGYMMLAAGLGVGRLRVRDLPPADARLLQGQHVPRRRLGHARHERRRRHAPLRRAAAR